MASSWRDNRTTAARGYGARWQRARVQYLQEHPVCVMCARRGLLVPAGVVDHIVAHRGDMALFWSVTNWQALCKPCHDTHKARQERGLRAVGCDVDGRPLDARHHWHDAAQNIEALDGATGDLNGATPPPCTPGVARAP
jgi:5-methylcytosine-specific restriction protein A